MTLGSFSRGAPNQIESAATGERAKPSEAEARAASARPIKPSRRTPQPAKPSERNIAKRSSVETRRSSLRTATRVSGATAPRAIQRHSCNLTSLQRRRRSLCAHNHLQSRATKACLACFKTSYRIHHTESTSRLNAIAVHLELSIPA